MSTVIDLGSAIGKVSAARGIMQWFWQPRTSPDACLHVKSLIGMRINVGAVTSGSHIGRGRHATHASIAEQGRGRKVRMRACMYGCMSLLMLVQARRGSSRLT